MLRNLKVGTKLFTILLAPVLVILVLVTVGVRDRLDVARNADRVEELARFASSSADLAQQLQGEAIWSVNVGASDATVGVAELQAQRERTDAAVQRFEQAIDEVDPGSEGGSIAEALRLVDARLGSLASSRTSVDIGQVQPYAIADLYTNAVRSLVGLNGSLVTAVNDPELLRGLDTVVALERVKEAQGSLAAQVLGPARERAFLDRAGDVCTTRGTECDSYTRVETASQDVTQADRAFDEGSATPDEKQIEQNARAAQRFDEEARLVLQQGAEGGAVTVPPDDLTRSALERLDALAAVDALFTSNVIDAARERGDEASQAVTFYLIGGLGALVLAFGIAVAVSRSVTRPLAKLTTAANTLSNEQLPALVEQLRNPEDEEAEAVAESLAPIEVDSRDEIGQLAEAFNNIQSVTVDVAEEQSRLLRKGIGDIFVHLARRNQSLLDRQIEFIDSLERHEKDPDQLDNLFKLDHLATRMRRNAESLLVLAGAEPPRRRGRPVPVTDVVRVAIGEVEDFNRIRIVALDEATVAGNVAVDLAHMLSELMENATHFSPPDTGVEVLGRRDDRNGYVLTVTDRGIGMNAEQLAEANAMLAKPPLVGLSLSRSLGFIVIARLAARFGLAVSLEPTPNGGTTAVVTLPYTLVEYPEDREPVEDPTEAALADAPPRRQSAARRSAPTAPARPALDVPADALAPHTAEEPARPAPPATPPPVVEPVAEQPLDPTPAEAPGPSVPVGADEPPLAPPALPTRQPVPATASTAAGLPARRLTSRTPATERDNGNGTGRPPAAAPSPPVPPGVLPSRTPAEPQGSPGGGGPGDMTAAGLVKRTPKDRTATPPDPLAAAASAPRPATRSSRSPDEVRRMLSRYRSGLDRGRQGDGGEPGTDGDGDA